AAYGTRHGIPFGCVRAISDTADTALSPALLSVLSGGQVSPSRLASVVLRAPRVVPELWRLGRDTRRAARRLASVLHRLVGSGGCEDGESGENQEGDGVKAAFGGRNRADLSGRDGWPSAEK